MIRIGIVGAQNSHCGHIARICNVEKRVPARVVAVWGETAELARAAAETGKIPTVVADWRDMAGKIDGVVIDHRHPKHHAAPARFFLRRGVPTFVDKPFTHTLREARALCALARKTKTPMTSFSVIALEESFRRFKSDCAKIGRLASFDTFGPGDADDSDGGVFFYGVHQVEAIVELLGHAVESVSAVRHGRTCVAVLRYRRGPVATLHLLHHANYTFHWAAVGDQGVLARDHARDATLYLGGVKMIVKMFKSGEEPLGRERLLAPVAILAAIEKSLKTGKPARLPRL